MKGVRHLFGGAALHSPPVPINIEQHTLVTPATPLILSNKPSWPPSPLQENTPQPGIQFTSHTHISSHENKNSAGSNDEIHEDQLYDFNEELNPTSGTTMDPADSPQRNDYRPYLTAGFSYSKFSARNCDQSSADSLENLFESHLKKRNNLANIQDDLYMILLASQMIVESVNAELLTAVEFETLTKEYRFLSDRQNSLALRFSLETKIRDAAISLLRVNASHKGILKQTSEQLETSTRKVKIIQTELRTVSEHANTVQCRLSEHRSGVLSLSSQFLELNLFGTNEPYSKFFLHSSNRNLFSSTNASRSHLMKFGGPHFFAGHARAVTINHQHTHLFSNEFVNLKAKLKASIATINAFRLHVIDSRDTKIQPRKIKKNHEVVLLGHLSAMEKQLLNVHEELTELHTFKQDIDEIRNRNFKSEIDHTKLLEQRGALEQLEQQPDVKMNDSFLIKDFSSYSSEQCRMQLQNKNIEIEQLKTHIRNVSNDLIIQKRSSEQGDTLRLEIEEDLRRSLDRYGVLNRDLEEAQRKKETVQAAANMSNSQFQLSAASFADFNSDIKKWYETLLPVWNALPSPEARALKFGLRKFSPVASHSSTPIFSSSLSDADAKNSTMLYDESNFTIEKFAARLHAVIADDRALIERIVRFAQAHELLKKNAERAQKLAQESSIALETYQKQVKELEDRNMLLASGHAELQEEVQQLRALTERLTVEKDDIEKTTSTKAEKSQQFSEAGGKQSAKTLALAEDASTTPEALKEKLEVQLADCMAKLNQARSEVETMRNSEHTQRIALLEEINSVQTENSNLRAQLRLAKK